MSLNPPSVTRNTPPAERSTQRPERAPAGDFAALLDLAPAPTRAPLARAAERHDASGSRADRPERSEAASACSRHARPGGGGPAAAAGREAPSSAQPQGKGPDAHVAPAPADASAAAPGRPEAAELPTPTVSAPAVPRAGVDIGVAVAVDLPTTPPSTDLAFVAVSGGPPAAAAVAAAAAEPTGEGPVTSVPPALAFRPAGLPIGTTTPGAAGAAEHVAVMVPTPVEGAPVAEAALAGLPAPAAAVSAETVAAAVATAAAVEPALAPSAEGSPSVPVAAAPATAEAPTALSGAEAGFGAEGEPAPTPLPTGTGTATGSGSGSGSGSPRDGEVARAAADEEATGASSGVPAPGSAPAPAAPQGAGRGPDVVPFGSQRAVPLERAPRAVAQLLRVAAQAGVSHARIALRPVELGGIEIFLQVSPAGLAAQVIADSPEAARMLAQGTEDLRRSLAGQNVELVSIDVSTSAEQQQREDLASNGFLADDHIRDGRPAPRRGDAGAAAEAAAPDLTPPTVLELPDGLLVDVLA